MASFHLLRQAAVAGRADEVEALIARGIDVNETDESGCTALLESCRNGRRGHTKNVVTRLLAAGAEVNKADEHGATPLRAASFNNPTVASLLLAAGAEVNKTDKYGDTPLQLASFSGNLDVIKLLSSYGASRTWADGDTAEAYADRRGHINVRDWLVLSRHWTTPLHHLIVIDAARARALLRDGADIHAAAANVPDAPTPVSLAQALHTAGSAPEGSPADLVLQAARPWSRETHALFPACARARARILVLLGHRLSRQPHFAGEEQALMDVWLEGVMPCAVTRKLV